MQVQVGVHRHGVLDAPREPQTRRKKHEDAGQLVVDLAQPHPEAAVLEILGTVAGPLYVDVLENLVEYVTHDDTTCKRGIHGTVEYFGKTGRFLLLAVCEGVVRAWQA